MVRKTGRRMGLSPGRAMVSDLLRAARPFALLPVVVEIDVSRLVALRRAGAAPVSWTMILMKAYAMVAREIPEFRRTFVSFPWPHLYEHIDNIAILTIEREHEGERRLFFARFDSPESDSLPALQSKCDHYHDAPVASIRQFRHQVSFSKCPWWIRRLGWILLMHLSPSKRVHNLGTFGISLATVGRLNAFVHMAPVTTILGCASPDKEGLVRLTLTGDHRVMDAGLVGRAVSLLREKLFGPIAQELRALSE